MTAPKSANLLIGCLLALATLAPAFAAAQPIELELNRRSTGQLDARKLPDRQILLARKQRREFLAEQRRLRARDRQAATRRAAKRPPIATFRRNCQVQPFGSKFLPNCS